MRAPEI